MFGAFLPLFNMLGKENQDKLQLLEFVRLQPHSHVSDYAMTHRKRLKNKSDPILPSILRNTRNE